MNRSFSLRLLLDLVACVLLLVSLAYDWLGNTAHEIMGTAMFLLLVSHNIFNRRWYGTVTRKTRAPRTLATKAINLTLLVTMLTLLTTSVLISQMVFAFLPLNSTYSARQVHILVGYLALIIAAIHLGLHWTMIMGFVRTRLGITAENRWANIALRGLAVAIAAFGVHSLFALNVGSKLLMQASLEFWNFETSTPAFFSHLVGVVGLGAFLAHYFLKFVATSRSP